MMINQRSIAISCLAIIISTSTASRADGQSEEGGHHAHEAHVHGEWELFAALDGKQLSVTLKGPLVDVVGFEHQPSDEKDRAAVQDLKMRLDKSETLFVLNDRANCGLVNPVNIILPKGFSQDATHEGDPHDHEDHDHEDDEHDHEDGKHDHGDDEHDHEDDKHDHEDDEHDEHSSNLEVSYMFSCKAPQRLRTITLTGFDTFPSIEKVDAVFLGDAKQVARRLERQSKTLKIQ